MMITQILLIDDDPIINFIHGKLIQKRLPGTPLTIFERAKAALMHIKSNPSDSFLVFLDINMPEMNGWEFLNAIALEAEAINIQVHIVTSSVDPEDRKEAESHKNVHSFMVKPLKDSDLDALPQLNWPDKR